jgi:succinyl-diaminopimelate desuccinylase
LALDEENSGLYPHGSFRPKREMTQTEKLLHELIALPSVNPAFLSTNDSQTGERRVTEFVATELQKAGLAVEFQNVLPNRPNVVARFTPQQKIRRRILLAPHLDTVPAVSNEQFIPIRRNGRLFGRGACDTKGSVAAMVAAICELAKSKNHPRGTEIIFAGLVDEENAQSGSQALIKSGLKADLAIVGEPTRTRIVTAHKGSLWLQLETRGKSAHGARPELGRNAVYEMARIVNVLETNYAKQLRRLRHPLLGHATVSVGMIRGGKQPNVVPDHCVITIDRRTLPNETQTKVCREITALLSEKNLQARFSNARPTPSLPLETNPDFPLVRQFMRCAAQRVPVGVDFFCDAAVLSQGGIPSIVFGPGDIAQAHTADEWISLKSLERAKNILLRFLRTLT